MNGTGFAEILEVSGSDYLSNPRLCFKSNQDVILFEADTYFFDWTVKDYQEGHLQVTLRKNPVTMIMRYE